MIERAGPILLTAGLIAGCATSPPPSGLIDAVDRNKVNRVEVSLRFHRVSIRSAEKIDAVVDYFNARTGNWKAPDASPPPAALASLFILEMAGTHRVLGLGCGFFSTARSSQAHALRDRESFLVRYMTATDLNEFLQIVDDSGLTALFSECKI